MAKSVPMKSRGLIEKHISLQHFDLTLVQPSEGLADCVENYWIIEWDMAEGKSFTQVNLPHSSQHLVIDPQHVSGVFGLTSGVFRYYIEGKGRIFGLKFLPGQFKRFAAHTMSHLTDQSVPISSYFDVDDDALVEGFVQTKHAADFAQKIEDVVAAPDAVGDEKSAMAQAVVEYVDKSREVFEVEAVARHFDVSPRSLQRLCADYIGISPKWIIERYRMLEAVEAMNDAQAMSLTELAHLLGYFDQAHFSKAFKRLTGLSPSEVNRPLG